MCAQDAKVSDAHEAWRQYVQQEASKKLFNELRHLLLAENLRQSEVTFRIRRVGNAPGFLQYRNEEEPQRARPLIHCIRRQLAVAEQMLLANVRRLELIRRPLEVLRQIFDRLHVRAFGTLGVIPTLEFLEHHLS
jgi:hypothetical protein